MGYPYGLSETKIPLEGRIMALVDVYDALVSERPYKKALMDADATEVIMSETGKRFDPKSTGVFFAVKDKFEAINNLSSASDPIRSSSL
jgi:putative two-component system response regulator